MEKLKPGFVLFDLDGTLIDSVPDLAYCVDEMMKQLDMPVRGEDAVRDWVGNGVQRLTERALIGAVEGIEWMLKQGYRIACVTNKAEAFTIPLLKDKGLHDYFEFIVSGDTCAEKKPHPMPLLHAAKLMGVEPENALMVGDSRSDVKAARAAGFHIFCMTYGYNHGEDIRDYNPDVILDSFAEFPSYIESK